MQTEMKKLILSAILFLGITATGFSQDKPQRVQKTPEERAQMMTDALDKKLSLSESQKTQIYQINLERAQAMNNAKTDKKEVDRSQMKAQFEASENKIVSILNDEQKATYAKLKEEREAKMKQQKEGRKKELKN
ncbi:MAG: hypothetical protein ACO1N7_12120 [Sphingobacteriaceae bacterium]